MITITSSIIIYIDIYIYANNKLYNVSSLNNAHCYFRSVNILSSLGVLLRLPYAAMVARVFNTTCANYNNETIQLHKQL